MIINIQDDILKIQSLGLLDKLLTDKTTGRHILWATDAYTDLGPRYGRSEQISTELITGSNASVIKTRARKEMEQQSSRTRQHGEVSTPFWVCKKMCDYADEMWDEKFGWQKYVDARVLEITCGEAPFLVSRYDAETGNISNIFGAPAVVREIVEKLTPAHEEGKKADPKRLDGIDTVTVNEDGEVEIPNETIIGRTQDLFGSKVYEITDIQSQVEAITEDTSIEAVDQRIKTLTETVKAHIKENVIAPVVGDYGMKKSAQARLEKQVEQKIDHAFQKIQGDYEQQSRIAQAELERKQQAATSAQAMEQAKTEYQAAMDSALKSFVETVQETVQQTTQDTPTEVVEQVERHKAEQEKKSVEDEVRDHLRGFSRTIPSFIMAYGDGHLTLANFDAYTEADVFQEVTGITINDFRFLRDGGEYTDPKTGESKHFEGHFFDEVVFNDSVEEFWKKKQQLADYFDESQDEDIFDYIPPQKTNQIFTPRWVVSMMVDQLEENNPGCFDDPGKTFADLYMKSGLYITEIVKRLYRSAGLKAAFPDEKERIRHILQKQVYGMAPTRIIYLIATNYILGFDDELKVSSHNFVQAEAAKQGALGKLVDQYFGGLS